MSIYIQDDKKHTVRQYFTTLKVERAIETLLKVNKELVYSETHNGYTVNIVDEEEI